MTEFSKARPPQRGFDLVMLCNEGINTRENAKRLSTQQRGPSEVANNAFKLPSREARKRDGVLKCESYSPQTWPPNANLMAMPIKMRTNEVKLIADINDFVCGKVKLFERCTKL